MTEVQLKQGLLSAVQAAQSRTLDWEKLTEEVPELELMEALNVLEEVLPGTDPKELYESVMNAEIYSPEEIAEQYEASERATTEQQWEEAMSQFLLMCMNNLSNSEKPTIDLNPSLHDPER